jgi:8-oxo-dGTP diphosphatase
VEVATDVSVLHMTALVDAPPCAVSAALSFGQVAPGDEITVAGCRLRVVESTVDTWRAVLVGARPATLQVSVRLSATAAGVLVTCSSTGRGLAPSRSRQLSALTALAERIRCRATELTDAEVIVGAAIVRDGQLLAQQRAYPAADAGRWELPGGRVEPGEDDRAAVVRECAEELGVRVTAGEPVGPDVALGRSRVLRVYRATLVAGDPRPHDHQALRWLTAGQLGSVPWLPADRVLIPAMRALLR